MLAAWAEATAKVNLGLAVTGPARGWLPHARSVFLRLALHDHLEVRPAADPAGRTSWSSEGDPGLPGTTTSCCGPRPPCAPLAARPNGRLPALRFRLDKHIPVAAGLAGGSSDAAAALELAAGAWGLSLDRATLLAGGRRLGADVPFFVAAHAARS